MRCRLCRYMRGINEMQVVILRLCRYVRGINGGLRLCRYI